MLKRTHTGGLVTSNIWSVVDSQATMIGRAVLAELDDDEQMRLEAMVRALAECDCEGNA